MLLVSFIAEGDGTKVYLSGPIDERAGQALSGLDKKLGRKLTFNFKDVEYINSLGVRSWVNFLRHVQEGRMIFFEDCTPDIVMQLNMTSVFKGSAKVLSILGEYTCPDCGNEEVKRFDLEYIESLEQDLVSQKCSACGANLYLDEDEETYLDF